MNIFKVLASGKKSFYEEYASAVLAWFLNPRMEHGLGYQFLLAFIEQLAKKEPDLQVIKNGLVSRMRSEHETETKFDCILECAVDNAFVDIVLGIDPGANKGKKWVIGIENKIYEGSVTEKQLQREYDGIKSKFKNAAIVMAYIAPADSARAAEEFENLKIAKEDNRVLMFWQKSQETPSIAGAIIDIIEKESIGSIDPIPEYTRHTLKALLSFIENNFQGYDYERPASKGMLNPLSEGKYTITDLKDKSKGFVGVQHGVSGLLSIEKHELQKRTFQFTTQPMENRHSWLPVVVFNDLVAWRLDGKIPQIEWDHTLPFEIVDKIVDSFQGKVFIGIRGGLKRLEELNWEEITDRPWEILSKQKSNQWIPGDQFLRVVSEKRPQNTEA